MRQLIFSPAGLAEGLAAGKLIIDQTSGVTVCKFPDRASLETAMRQWHPDQAEAIGRLVPTGS